MATILGTDKGEVLNGTVVADVIKGFGGNDTLLGQGGADLLDGGTGMDTMAGGEGNDIFYVTNGGDRVAEGNRNGTDEVRTSLPNYVLGPNVENLRHTGTGNFSGTGNALNNIITGGEEEDRLTGLSGDDTLNGREGNDLLDGGLGMDRMVGGEGGDIYDVDHVRDQVVEGNRGGTDEVRTTLTSLTLGRNVENLTYTGSQQFTGVGNALSNIIKGGGLADVMTGGGGNDRLFGGAGQDTAVLGGKREDYVISTTGAMITIVDMNASDGNDGKDILDGIERVQFADGVLDISLAAVVDLGMLDGTNGFRLIGIDENDRSGSAVSSAGDVNGDGFGDVIVGAPSAGTGEYEGESYVVFGKENWASHPVLDLALLDGTNGFRLHGIDPLDSTGVSVSDAGDINGDGFGDLVIGAVNGEEDGVSQYDEGEAYVVFGRANWAGTSSVDLAALDGTDGFRMLGVNQFDFAGRSVSAAGDVNGDGFEDIVVGASGALGLPGYDRTYEGASYVVFGRADWSATPVLNLENLDGANGFSISGVDVGDASGRSVSSAGDVNGDGYGDLVIGAPDATTSDEAPNSGESYVVFGKADWEAEPSLDLSSLDGTNGFSLPGIDPTDRSGTAVSSAGDINGDGFGDIIIGAPMAGGDVPEGASYVVFGKADWAGTASLPLLSLDGTNGFRLTGSDMGDGSGVSVASAGDTNGDGYSDLIIGAPLAEASGGGNQEGESYVVYGKANWDDTPAFDLLWLDGSNGFRLVGVDQDDLSGTSVASAGDVNGDGLADLIVGAPAAENKGGPSSEGESYIVFGRASESTARSMDILDLLGLPEQASELPFQDDPGGEALQSTGHLAAAMGGHNVNASASVLLIDIDTAAI